MRYHPTIYRMRRRPVPPAAVTLLLPGGMVGLDLAGVFHQLEVRELLRDSGVRGRV